MKKALALLVGLCSLGLTEQMPPSAMADCGKMIIVVHHWPAPPPPPPPPVCQCPPKITMPKYPQGQPITLPPEIWNNLQQKQRQEIQNSINNTNNNIVKPNINITVNVGKKKKERIESYPGWASEEQEPEGDGGESGLVQIPEPIDLAQEGGAVAYGNKAFLEGEQQAVIAWNGKTDASGEETLILTTNEMSNTGKPMAMLSVLPLPGKPISIERANVKVFVQTKVLLEKKLKEKKPDSGSSVGYGAIMTQKIGSHNIFVWEMEDISKFKQEVTSYVAAKYDNKATALITDETLKVVKSYHDRGFRYFAFDLTLVEKKASTKEAIAYRFKSTFAYYPLAISAIGGTGQGLIDLIVITPGTINLGGAFQKGKEEAPVIVRGNTSVDFTLKEVNDLDPSLSVVFKAGGLNSVLARNFLIETDDIGKFKNDFIAVPAK